ncbi:MAG: DMT family transporter [Candidatus Carbobacillus altaicus]|uniref:Permease of the drug/metabolite transporter (DMT) superfamily n=1 Tax=Candidatus Carbonibacillus altaicus TaxID=2163959 RepID=A0A2R6XZD3_9BACL|nr:DMT family transporter [Candidatus Carbobacillus altaicus]PTQ55772.1 MAG: Permease of the drug/metabolite transporter (DMT) superfamily [Candidatus Carbobacillus altaicus]
MQKFLPYLAVFLGASLYGTLSPVVKAAYDASLTFSEVTFGQFWSAGLLLLIFYPLWARRFTESRKVGREHNVRFDVKTILFLVALGVFGLSGVSLFYYGALVSLPASLSLVLLFQFVWMGVLAERLFFRVPITKMRALAMLTVFAGDLLAMKVWAIELKGATLEGLLFGLMAAVSYTFFLVGSAKIPETYPTYWRTLVMVLAGTVSTGLVLWVLFPGERLIPHDSHHLFYIFWLGLLGQVLPPLLFAWGAPRAGGMATTLISSVELPVGLILAVFWLKEELLGWQWLGIVLILTGIVLAVRSQEREPGTAFDSI